MIHLCPICGKSLEKNQMAVYLTSPSLIRNASASQIQLDERMTKLNDQFVHFSCLTGQAGLDAKILGWGGPPKELKPQCVPRLNPPSDKEISFLDALRAIGETFRDDQATDFVRQRPTLNDDQLILQWFMTRKSNS